MGDVSHESFGQPDILTHLLLNHQDPSCCFNVKALNVSYWRYQKSLGLIRKRLLTLALVDAWLTLAVGEIASSGASLSVSTTAPDTSPFPAATYDIVSCQRGMRGMHAPYHIEIRSPRAQCERQVIHHPIDYGLAAEKFDVLVVNVAFVIRIAERSTIKNRHHEHTVSSEECRRPEHREPAAAASGDELYAMEVNDGRSSHVKQEQTELPSFLWPRSRETDGRDSWGHTGFVTWRRCPTGSRTNPKGNGELALMKQVELDFAKDILDLVDDEARLEFLRYRE